MIRTALAGTVMPENLGLLSTFHKFLGRFYRVTKNWMICSVGRKEEIYLNTVQILSFLFSKHDSDLKLSQF